MQPKAEGYGDDFTAKCWHRDGIHKWHSRSRKLSPHVRESAISGKFLLFESGIQRTGIQNPQWFGIRNQLWYGIRKPKGWNPESGDPESRSFMDENSADLFPLAMKKTMTYCGKCICSCSKTTPGNYCTYWKSFLIVNWATSIQECRIIRRHGNLKLFKFPARQFHKN